ncbi:MAG TPA: T9SS type A sorting domain-containing protein [Candidatus Kapabacteria bacterium]|nr:T9SS type A sorting domain-containing protein [Candidatus Kapabacteria bacterium]
MKLCFPFLLLIVLATECVAQPSIRLIDSAKKSWMPDGKGTVGLRFRNAGNKPLIVTAGTITSSANVFKLNTSFTTPKIVAPGDSSYVIVEVNAQIAYEYFARVDLVTNDPARPVASFSLRVNDSIPPNPVRLLNASPLKGGQLTVNWLPPSTSRDKDSIVFYRVFLIAKDGESEEIYSGKANSVTTKSKFENDVIVTVLSYDDMGNRSVTLDTTWIDRSKPSVQIKRVDPQFDGIPEHIERGNPNFILSIRDWHMGRYDAYWREPGTSFLNPIAQASSFTQFEEVHTHAFHWNTSQLRGRKELVIISRDKVDNADTTIYPVTISQLRGWPKRMENHDASAGVTIAKDEGGRFLMTGADIANGVFRPNGHHYFYNWPLDVTRAGSDQVITSAADLDQDNLSEVIVISKSNAVTVLDHHGMTETEFGMLTSADRYASVVATADVDLILAGPSPIVVRDAESGEWLTYGATQSWTSAGIDAGLRKGTTTEGVREKDRFAIANLLSHDRESVVQVHDNGEWEELIIRTATGKQEVGPIPVWRPTTAYNGFYPSIGDINADGDIEIVLPAANDSLYAFHHDGTRVAGYPIHIKSSTSGRNQAMLVDLDRDGASDIVLPVEDSIVAISGRSATQIRSTIWPIRRNAPGTSLITIADLNSDGYLELIEPPSPGDTSWVHMYDLDVRNEPGTIEWGTLQHDMMRSGNHSTPAKDLQSSVKSKQIASGYMLNGKKLSLARGGVVRVSDILGREILSQTSQTNELIDLNNLPSGVYMINIDELEVIKIIL